MKFPKTPRPRNRAFLAWAKGQAGPCCICRDAPGSELHHWGESGMGLKGSDYRVARVCRGCHGDIQGKGRKTAIMSGDFVRYSALLEDTVTLLEAYSEANDGTTR
jgi:hypothetical protein